jgi:hypothetical protein
MFPSSCSFILMCHCLKFSCRCSTLHVSAYMAIFRSVCSWINLLRCFCCLFLARANTFIFVFFFFCCFVFLVNFATSFACVSQFAFSCLSGNYSVMCSSGWILFDLCAAIFWGWIFFYKWGWGWVIVFDWLIGSSVTSERVFKRAPFDFRPHSTAVVRILLRFPTLSSYF